MAGFRSQLIYGVDDRLPWAAFLLVSFQHVVAMFSGVVIVPLIIAKGAGFSFAETERIINTAIFASAFSTIIQMFRTRFLGCGYLCPMGSSSTFIPVAISAGLAGGMPLVCGMTIALAPVEMVMGYFSARIIRFIPHWLRGSMIALIAVSLIPLSFQMLQGEAGSVYYRSWQSFSVGFGVILLTILFSKSKNAYVEMSAVLFATVIAFVVAAIFGMIDFAPLMNAKWLEVHAPLQMGFRFSWGFAVPFAICYVITTIETFGDMYAFASVSDDRQKEPTQEQVRGGVIGAAAGSVICGLLGTVPNTPYLGHAAIIRITRVSSRITAVGVAAFLLILWLFPKLSVAVALLPYSVVGGVVVLAAAFMIMVAVEMIRVDVTWLDAFLIGAAGVLTLALSVKPTIISDYLPASFRSIKVLFESGMTCGALFLIAYTLLVHLLRPILRLFRRAVVR